ncbi:MAG: DUF5652 family protein [Candidatus Peregrinibacteria bacterium]
MTLIQNLEGLANSQWLIPLIVWSLIWKGIGLWKCGRHNQLYWFIAILVLNTVGILPIVYLLWFQKKCPAK